VDVAAMVRADLIIASMLEEVRTNPIMRWRPCAKASMWSAKPSAWGACPDRCERANPHWISGIALQDLVIAEMLLGKALDTNTYELIPTGIVTIDC
jgi:hypothetical protein